LLYLFTLPNSLVLTLL